MARVRIQVIKVYEIEVGDDDPITEAYGMSTTEIEEDGELIDASTDHAEEV